MTDDILALLRARAAKVADDLPDVVVGFDAALELHALYFRAANEIEQLRAAVGVHAGIVARINDGWRYVLPSSAGPRGEWWRLLDDPEVETEPMTEAAQLLIYGEVVARTASGSATTDEGVTGRHAGNTTVAEVLDQVSEAGAAEHQRQDRGGFRP